MDLTNQGFIRAVQYGQVSWENTHLRSREIFPLGRAE